MRAIKQFTRTKGGTNTLGSDGAPTTSTELDGNDNVFVAPSMSSWSSGFRALGLLLHGPSDLNVEVYVFDELTARWYLTAAASTLKADQVSYFRIPNPTTHSVRLPDGTITKDDYVKCYVRLIDPGAAGAGSYVCAPFVDYANS